MTTAQILSCVAASHEALDSLGRQADKVAAACDLVVSTFRSGNKVLTCGNGGSAAEALHMAEEAIGRYRGNRVSLPAVCLSADCTALTCIGNDFGFDSVFSRQVEGLGKEGDLLVLFTSSGNSRNLLSALETARTKKVWTLAILGKTGGLLAGRADVEIIIEGSDTARIQEAHQLLMHIILEAVEQAYPQVP